MKKILVVILFLYPLTVKAEMSFTNYIVKDINSNKVFEEKAANIKKLPASTTKIMTAIVAIENKNQTEPVKIGNEILTVDGSNIYIEKGETLLMDDLLKGMLMRSGNDAAMTVAKSAGGSIENFIKLMNDKARTLKLTNTIFQNPTGLDDNEENYSTVKDLASLYSYAYKNEYFKKIIKLKEYKTSSDKKSYYFKNRSKILFNYNKCTGAKTGYTPKAGRLLVSSASNKDLDIVIVTIGNTYGYKEHINKYEEIFKEYKNYKILKKGKKIKIKNKKYIIKKDFYYPLKQSEKENIKVKINKGTKEIIVYKEKEIIHKEKLKKEKESILEKLKNIIKF